jgi:C4-dicarboxylate-specific signal transduction histidine kinase
MLASLTLDVASDLKDYYTGSLYDIPLISSFLWFALAGVIAYQLRDKLDAPTEDHYDSEPDSSSGEKSVWASRLAMAAVLSLPLFAIYTLRYGHDMPEVRDFRLMTTLVAALPLALIVFLRTHMADRDRSRLLSQSQQSIENLKRLQAQFVQSEKLVSLGQLAAGAAHEINNPLAAILGFSDLLADDQAIPERTLLDINTVVNNAAQLRALDLRSATTRVELQLESVLPGVRGDGNQLMQVFFNIISNALEAMEAAHGGVLTIKTIRDRSNVVALFSDSGPGIKEPHRVFDPFYTTKPVGKGTGLGLSICFGIIQEHAGKILCYNRQEGGAVFRVELPAVLAAFPAKDPQLTSTLANPAKPS